MTSPARSTQACALVVDDERDIRELLVLTLGRMGLRCDTASSLADARSLLRQNRYALCLTDMRLADGSGVDLVREIAQLYSETPVAMITAFGNQDAAVGALEEGLQRITAEIGIGGDRIRAVAVESLGRIALRRRTDVAAFHVEDRDCPSRPDGSQRFFQDGHPSRAMTFEECRLRFENGNLVPQRIHHNAGEFGKPVGVVRKSPGL